MNHFLRSCVKIKSRTSIEAFLLFTAWFSLSSFFVSRLRQVLYATYLASNVSLPLLSPRRVPGLRRQCRQGTPTQTECNGTFFCIEACFCAPSHHLLALAAKS